MDSLILLVLVLVLIYVLVFKKSKWHRHHKKSVETVPVTLSENEEELEENFDYSQAYQPKWLFSYHEKDFYYKLKEFADKQGLYLFAKVRLLDLVEPRKNQKRYKACFYKVQAKHVDFVLCNEKLVAKWIVELDDASHQQKKRVERDTFVDEVLKSTGYVILHMNDYDEEMLKSAMGALTP